MQSPVVSGRGGAHSQQSPVVSGRGGAHSHAIRMLQAHGVPQTLYEMPVILVVPHVQVFPHVPGALDRRPAGDAKVVAHLPRRTWGKGDS